MPKLLIRIISILMSASLIASSGATTGSFGNTIQPISSIVSVEFLDQALSLEPASIPRRRGVLDAACEWARWFWNILPTYNPLIFGTNGGALGDGEKPNQSLPAGPIYITWDGLKEAFPGGTIAAGKTALRHAARQINEEMQEALSRGEHAVHGIPFTIIRVGKTNKPVKVVDPQFAEALASYYGLRVAPQEIKPSDILINGYGLRAGYPNTDMGLNSLTAIARIIESDMKRATEQGLDNIGGIPFFSVTLKSGLKTYGIAGEFGDAIAQKYGISTQKREIKPTDIVITREGLPRWYHHDALTIREKSRRINTDMEAAEARGEKQVDGIEFFTTFSGQVKVKVVDPAYYQALAKRYQLKTTPTPRRQPGPGVILISGKSLFKTYRAETVKRLFRAAKQIDSDVKKAKKDGVDNVHGIPYVDVEFPDRVRIGFDIEHRDALASAYGLNPAQLEDLEPGDIVFTAAGLRTSYPQHVSRPGSLLARLDADIQKAKAEKKSHIGGVPFFETRVQENWIAGAVRAEFHDRLAEQYGIQIGEVASFVVTDIAITAAGLRKAFPHENVYRAQHLAQKINEDMTKAKEMKSDVAGKVGFFYGREANVYSFGVHQEFREALATKYRIRTVPLPALESSTDISVTIDALKYWFDLSTPEAMLKVRQIKNDVAAAELRGDISFDDIEYYKAARGKHEALLIRDRSRGALMEKYGLTVRTDLEDELLPAERLGVLDAVGLLAEAPIQLQRYIEMCHPELSPEESASVTVSALKGLQTEWTVSDLEDEFQPYAVTLNPPQITDRPEETSQPSFVLKGITPLGATHLQVSGAYTRRFPVKGGLPFAVTLPLPRRSETNPFMLFAIDQDQMKISPRVFFTVRQTGAVKDETGVLLDLLATKEGLLEEIQRDEVRRAVLVQAVEESQLKYFTYGEAEGLANLKQKVEHEVHPAKRAVYETVYKEFKQIHDRPYPGVRTDVPGQRVYFFQKYVEQKVYERRKRGENAVVLALDPGLGKTLIALLISLRCPATIIAPNAVVTTWLEEEEKFLTGPRLETIEGPYAERDQLISGHKRPALVTNVEYVRTGDDDQMPEVRLAGLSRPTPDGMLIVDEAGFLTSKTSKQSKGIRLLKAGFRLALSATPFNHISQIVNVLNFLDPADLRFQSMAAFRKAFNVKERQDRRALLILMRKKMIRLAIAELFNTFDPNIPLELQNDRLPARNDIRPDEDEKKLSRYTLSLEQSESILELFTNPRKWYEKQTAMIQAGKAAESVEDRRFGRYRGGFFAKREAVRQIMNNPKYIGRSDISSPKHDLMARVLEEELDEKTHGPNQKAIIFCRYIDEVETYRDLFKGKYGATAFYGGLPQNPDGYKWDNDKDKNLLYYEVDEFGKFLLKDGRPIPSDAEHGQLIKALDYERLVFQNDPDCRVMFMTWDTGSVGITLTAASVVIFSDLAKSYRDEYQGGGRAIRIDNDRKKKNVRYRWMLGDYDPKFLQRLDPRIREELFEMGTFEQVQYNNLRRQARPFHYVMDGLGNPEDLNAISEGFMKEHMPFMFEEAAGATEDVSDITDEIPGVEEAEIVSGTDHGNGLSNEEIEPGAEHDRDKPGQSKDHGSFLFLSALIAYRNIWVGLAFFTIGGTLLLIAIYRPHWYRVTAQYVTEIVHQFLAATYSHTRRLITAA